MKFIPSTQIYDALKDQVEAYYKARYYIDDSAHLREKTDNAIGVLDNFFKYNRNVNSLVGLMDADLWSLTSKFKIGDIFIPNNLKGYVTKDKILNNFYSNDDNTFGFSATHRDCCVYIHLKDLPAIAKVTKWEKSKLFVPTCTFEETEIKEYFSCVDYFKENNMKVDNDFVQASRFVMGIITRKYSPSKGVSNKNSLYYI